jgi:hypothetical protein
MARRGGPGGFGPFGHGFRGAGRGGRGDFLRPGRMLGVVELMMIFLVMFFQ